MLEKLLHIMVLGFKTNFPNGRKTYFVQKILANVLSEYKEAFRPKKHTIRAGKRWKAGMKIHMAVGVRTKNYSQFNGDGIGLDRVISVQEIEIKYENSKFNFPNIYIDGRKLSISDKDDYPIIERLVINDGFDPLNDLGDSFYDFLDWFSSDFSGQIIHWTDERYDFPMNEHAYEEAISGVSDDHPGFD